MKEIDDTARGGHFVLTKSRGAVGNTVGVHRSTLDRSS